MCPLWGQFHCVPRPLRTHCDPTRLISPRFALSGAPAAGLRCLRVSPYAPSPLIGSTLCLRLSHPAALHAAEDALSFGKALSGSGARARGIQRELRASIGSSPPLAGEAPLSTAAALLGSPPRTQWPWTALIFSLRPAAANGKCIFVQASASPVSRRWASGKQRRI